MPIRAPRICSCGKTIASGAVCPCRAKRKAEADARRPSAAVRGYDAAWKRVRADFLKAHPWCCHPGCNKPATEADHVLSVAERPDLRLSWSNLRPFCKSHHSQRTARDQGFARSGAKPADRRAGSAPPGGGSRLCPIGGKTDRGPLRVREPNWNFSIPIMGLSREGIEAEACRVERKPAAGHVHSARMDVRGRAR